MLHPITIPTHLPGSHLSAGSPNSWDSRHGLDDLYNARANILVYASGRVMEATIRSTLHQLPGILLRKRYFQPVTRCYNPLPANAYGLEPADVATPQNISLRYLSTGRLVSHLSRKPQFVRQINNACAASVFAVSCVLFI